MKKKFIYVFVIMCSILLLTGCNLKKSDSKSSSASDNSSNSSVLAIDKNNSVICARDYDLDYSYFRRLKELIGEDSGRTYNNIGGFSMYDQEDEDRQKIIGKRYEKKIMVWNDSEDKIVEYYRTTTYEFNLDEVTSEMMTALEKQLTTELEEDSRFIDHKVVVNGKTVYAEGKVDISGYDEDETKTTKQVVFDNNNDDVYTCEIK